VRASSVFLIPSGVTLGRAAPNAGRGPHNITSATPDSGPSCGPSLLGARFASLCGGMLFGAPLPCRFLGQLLFGARTPIVRNGPKQTKAEENRSSDRHNHPFHHHLHSRGEAEGALRACALGLLLKRSGGPAGSKLRIGTARRIRDWTKIKCSSARAKVSWEA